MKATSGETPSSFVAALFAGGSSVSIVGSGALEPDTETFRLFYFFTALAGTAVTSLVSKYLMQVYTALLRRNTVALDVDTWSGQTGNPVELLTAVARLRHAGIEVTDDVEAGVAEYLRLRADWDVPLVRLADFLGYTPSRSMSVRDEADERPAASVFAVITNAPIPITMQLGTCAPKGTLMPAQRCEPLARELPAELEVAATNGSILTDSRGRKYIDFVMGWCVGNFGWGHPATTNAIARFKGPDYVYPGYSYASWTELARLLTALAPRPLTTCFRATGGFEAVDLALQAALIHTGRRAFLSLEDSYHGNSLAGLSIGASDSVERLKNVLPQCAKIAAPLDATALRRIEQRLKRRDVAAFIMEPISINLGVQIPEKDIIQRVRDLCRRHGTLFIADEVACGFGRTGRVFACEHFDLDPDMLCVAKAMSGGLAPIGAMIATAAIAKSMEENHGTFYSTYGWHPRSVAAAIATLRSLKANRVRLLSHVVEMSDYFRVRLQKLEFERPVAIRIQGLAIGLDVGDEDYADSILGKCRRNGLLVSTEGSTVLLLPSLVIDKRTAARGLDILARSI